MTKHTPGPWAIEARHPDKRITEILIPTSPGWAECTLMSADEVDIEVHKANVNLVVAAPELLDALDAVLGCSGMALPVEISQAAKAAIAKARGETK